YRWTPGNCDLRFAPLDEISGLAITGIVSDEVNVYIVAARRSRQFDAELLLVDHRIDGLHPRLRTVNLANVAYTAEFPERTLPQLDLIHHGVDVARFGRAPLSAQTVKQGRRVRALQKIYQYAQIFRAQIILARHAFDSRCST